MERTTPVVLTLLLTLTAIFTGGCANSQVQDERNALWNENQQLRSDREKLQAAFNASEAERQRTAAEQAAYAEQLQKYQTEYARLEGELAQRQAQPIVRANTGFAGIEGVETVQRSDGIGVRIPGDVLFSPGQAAVKSTAKATLDKIARVIRDQHKGSTIRIEGYTDSDPIKKSNWADNLELSLQRSAAVVRYLQSQGLDSKKLYAAGFGPNNPRETKARSRRVEIVVVGGES